MSMGPLPDHSGSWGRSGVVVLTASARSSRSSISFCTDCSISDITSKLLWCVVLPSSIFSLPLESLECDLDLFSWHRSPSTSTTSSFARFTLFLPDSGPFLLVLTGSGPFLLRLSDPSPVLLILTGSGPFLLRLLDSSPILLSLSDPSPVLLILTGSGPILLILQTSFGVDEVLQIFPVFEPGRRPGLRLLAEYGIF